MKKFLQLILIFFFAAGYFFSSVNAHAACSTNAYGVAGEEGEIETFFDDNIMRYCDGTDWIDMGVAGSDGAGNADPRVLIQHFPFINDSRQNLSADLVGNYLYFVTATNRFGIIDVSDPTDPVMVGSLSEYDSEDLNSPHDVRVSGNYAYISVRGSKQMLVVDVSDVTAPSILGTFTSSTYPSTTVYQIDVSGNYAFLRAAGDGFFGIISVDISTPSSPVDVSAISNATTMSIQSGWYASPDIVVSGNYAYTNGNMIAIIDITDPSNMVERGNLDPATYTYLDRPRQMAVNGSTLYVGNYSGYFTTVDVSDPDTPIVLDYIDVNSAAGADTTCTSSGWNDPYYADAITFIGNYAVYFDGNGRVATIDISDPSSLTAYCKRSHYDVPSSAFVFGSYILTFGGGNKVWDAADPTAVDHILTYTWGPDHTRYSAWPTVYGFSADSYDNIKFVVSSNNVNPILQLWDSTDPVNMVKRGEVTVPGRAITRGHVQDGYYYFSQSHGNSVLTIVDIADPDNPTFVNKLTSSFFTSIGGITGAPYKYKYGDLLLLIDPSNEKIVALDVSDPTSPSITSSAAATGISSLSMMVGKDNFLYMVKSDSTLMIWDISDPAAPVMRSSMTTSGNLNSGVDIYDNILYVPMDLAGSSNNMISAVDVSDPDNPIVVGSLPTGGVQGLTAQGNLLATFWWGSLSIYDVSDLSNITLAHRFNGGSFLANYGTPFFAGNYLYLGTQGTVIDPGTNLGAGGALAICTAPDGKIGQMFYDYNLNVIRVCNGTSWNELGDGNPGMGGCSPEGALRYETDRYQFCDGNGWVDVGK